MPSIMGRATSRCRPPPSRRRRRARLVGRPHPIRHLRLQLWHGQRQPSPPDWFDHQFRRHRCQRRQPGYRDASGSGSTVSVVARGRPIPAPTTTIPVARPPPSGWLQSGGKPVHPHVFGDVFVIATARQPSPLRRAPASIAYDYGVGDIAVSVGSGVSIQALTAATASGGGNAPYGIAATNRGSGNDIHVRWVVVHQFRKHRH